MSLPDRRTQIVDAALAVALRDGLERTTVRAIASEAGVSLGVLHYCFTDKSEIVQYLAQALSSHTLASALDALHTGYGQVDGVTDAYAAAVISGPEYHLLTFEITIAALRDPDLAGVAAAQHEARLASATRFVDQVADGQTDQLDPVRIARSLLSQLDAATLTWLVERDDAELRAGLSRTWSWLLDALDVDRGLDPPSDAGTLPL